MCALHGRTSVRICCHIIKVIQNKIQNVFYKLNILRRINKNYFILFLHHITKFALIYSKPITNRCLIFGQNGV